MVGRAVRAVVTSVLILCCAAPVSTAQDYSAAYRDLATGSDFRLRVSAALVLGKSRSPGARPALEKALGDPHPAVRAAAAAALGSVGDAGAVAALTAAQGKETSASVKAQLETTIKRLRSPVKAASVKAKFLLSLGRIENKSTVKDAAVTSTFKTSTRSQLAQIPGGEVLADDADVGPASRARGLPVFARDGAITRLSKGQSATETSYSANVEFLIRQVPDQALKGSVSGSAQAAIDARAIKGAGDLAQLQADAITAAVETALRGAPPALEAAAKN